MRDPTLGITASKGEIIVNQNNAVAPRNTALGPTADGQVLQSDSAEATGLIFGKVDLSSTNSVDNAVGIANGGTGAATKAAGFDALSPTTTRGDLIRRGASNNEVLTPAATGDVVYFDGTDSVFGKITSSMLGTALSVVPVDKIILKDDTKASGTSGGTATAGSWQIRDLTTEIVDTGAHCSLAANVFTLAAGTYRLVARVPGYMVGNHQARLYEVGVGVVSGGYGTNSRSSPTTTGAIDANITHSVIDVRFTSTGNGYRIEHRVEVDRASNGFGLAHGFGTTEIYTVVTIERES